MRRRQTDDDRAGSYAALLRRCLLVPLDGPIALEAARLSVLHGLAACDSLIYATATLSGATIVTTDADLDGLPGVEFHAQPGRSVDTKKARRAARRTEADAP